MVRLALLLASVAAAQNLSPVESGLLDEVNRLRANPNAWANVLIAERPWSPGKVRIILGDDDAARRTDEAVRDLEEAISALESVRGGLPAVQLSPGLSRAAADHVRDTGGRGLTSHRSSDGSTLGDRVQRYGTWSGTIAENIVYSTAGPRELVFQQLVDFGVADKGHRRTLLNPAWRFVGIACGPHAVFRAMCVLDFASDYREAIASSQSGPDDRPGKRR